MKDGCGFVSALSKKHYLELFGVVSTDVENSGSSQSKRQDAGFCLVVVQGQTQPSPDVPAYTGTSIWDWSQITVAFSVMRRDRASSGLCEGTLPLETKVQFVQ